MDNFAQNLESVLQNPQLMQQLMAMASSLNPTEQPPPEPKPEPPAEALPDMAAIQKLAGLATRTGIDADQQSLLRALSPYLSGQRIQRLERAMRAAKTARLATDLLGSGGLNFLTGR